jgi:hypothetical protein
MLHFAQQDKRIAPHPLPLSLERRGEFLSLAFKRRGTSAPDKPHPIVPRLQQGAGHLRQQTGCGFPRLYSNAKNKAFSSRE